MTGTATRQTLAETFGVDPHGPIHLDTLGADTYRLTCIDPDHPADTTTVTSPGGIKAWLRDHRTNSRPIQEVAAWGELL